jgi:voltage-gated potassium channel
LLISIESASFFNEFFFFFFFFFFFQFVEWWCKTKKAMDAQQIEIALSDEFGRMADESTRADVGAASRHEDHAPDGKPHTHMSVSHHHDKDKGHNDKSRAFADTDPYADARAAGYGNTRLALYGLLDGPSPALTPALRRVALVWQVLITLCIITSIVAFLVSTQASFYGRDNEVLAKIEIFVVTVFTVDYLGRLLLTPYPRFMLPYAWRCCKPPRAQASSRDLRTGFVWIFLNIVDLLSVVPFYVELIVAATAGGDSSSSGAFAAVRVLRLFRLARVLKVGRYVAILQIVGETLRRSVVGLGLLVFSVLVAGLLYGSIEFYAENFAGCVFDDKTMLWTYTSSGEPSPFQSVLQGTWWAIVTLTTVGYGDKFPLTWPGQVVAVFAILSGLVVLAFPITIISSNFIDVTAEVKVEADENEAVAKVDLSAIDARFSDMELVNVVKGELRNQADAINKLQETVDEMAFRWRSAEAAIRILERRARRADHQRLRSRRGAAAAAVDIELGARQLK